MKVAWTAVAVLFCVLLSACDTGGGPGGTDVGADAAPYLPPDDDIDQDGIRNEDDNCPAVANPEQLDSDDDGSGDACDPCNGPNTDTDEDEIPDCNDNCPRDADNDIDDDGVCGNVDNCREDANPQQEDNDEDGFGNVCDPCPDSTDDGDRDEDGTINCLDDCPDDPNKVEPGLCGCGKVDTADSDEDGTADCLDPCPLDADDDRDADEVCGDIDNCPGTNNGDQLDDDDDGRGNACDGCPNDPLNDEDDDLVCGDVDNCPDESNPGQEDVDHDDIGDVCDPDWVECYSPEDCEDDYICTIDRCIDGLCAHEADDSWCEDSNLCTDDICVPESGCAHENNTASCDDDNACTVTDMCQGGVCVGTQNECECEQDADCLDEEDGNRCNGTLICVGAACQVDPTTVVVCAAPENPCLVAECNPETGSCEEPAGPDETPCNDGNVCTPNDACSNGSCVGTGEISCDDSDPCTDDFCDPVAGCGHEDNEAACDDEDECTTDDVCQDGVCVGGPDLDCDDGSDCTADTCVTTAGCVHINLSGPCSDGNACTTGDTCSDGGCQPGEPKDCSDGNVCTDDSCSTLIGCTHTANTSPCDDGNDCTTADTCQDAACIGGVPPDCDDLNECTADACVQGAGCVNVAISVPCSDGNACTHGDLCVEGECNPGTDRICDDRNVCTSDSCDEELGCLFTSANEGLGCDDSNGCTDGDICTGGRCAGAGVDCDDDNPCTDDRCDDPEVGCYHIDNSSPCEDENFCTVGDACSNGECVPGMLVTCDDGNPCTNDACVPDTGLCGTTFNTAPCDDGEACTTGDVCSEGACVSGPMTACNDGNVCTDDTCDPMTGLCSGTFNSAPCEDENFCTVGDACSNGECVPGMLVTCDDGNPCTNDACVPDTGLCGTTFNTAPCDDGDGCTVDDACSLGACLSGEQMDCHDGNACTYDTCLDGECVHTARVGRTLSEVSGLKAAAARSDGSYLVGGTTVSEDGEERDGWVASLLPDGSRDWAVTVGGSADERLSDLAVLQSGSFVVLSVVYNDDHVWMDASLEARTATGGPFWSHMYGTERDSHDVPTAVVVLPDGFAMSGHTYSMGAGANDAWLVRTDSLGRVVWERAFGDADKDTALDLLALNAGSEGFAFVGSSQRPSYDSRLGFVDSSGTLVGDEYFGIPAGNDMAYSIAQLPAGGFALAGYGYFSSDDGVSFKGRVLTTNSSDSLISESFFGTEDAYDEFRKILVAANGNLLAGGTKGGNPGLAWVVRTDADGDQLWEWVAEGDAPQSVYDMVLIEEGGVLVVGSKSGTGFYTYLDAQGNECSFEDVEVCGSLDFDGDADFVEIPTSPELNLSTGSFTVEAWVYLTEYGSVSYSAIVSKLGYPHGGSGTGWVLSVSGPEIETGAGALTFHFFPGGDGTNTRVVRSSAMAVPLNTWTQVAATFTESDSMASLWVNGELQASQEVLPLQQTAWNLHVGAFFQAPCSDCHYWNGLIDEVRVSSVARYEADFTPKTYLMPDDDTVALWNLQEGEGNTAADSSGNGHDGTVSGASWSVEAAPAHCCSSGCPSF